MAKQEPPAPSADGAAAAAPTAKRARTALSLHEKAVVKHFCEQRAAESKARGELAPSQDQLRAEVGARFGYRCGRSTLSKIVAMDWAALQRGSLTNPNMKRQRRPLFPALEADLVAFVAAFLDAAGGRKPLTEALILEEAQRLKQLHGVREDQLVLSVGWLARFKHRHGIRLRKPAAGARSDADVPWGAVDPLFLPAAGEMDAQSARAGDAELLQSLEAQVADATAQNIDQPSIEGSTLCRLAFGGQSGPPADMMDKLPEEVRGSGRACGCSQLRGLDREHLRGLRIVLFGSSSIVDAFVAADYVGEAGSVACIDSQSASRELGTRNASQYLRETLQYPSSDPPALTFAGPGSNLGLLQGVADLVILDCSVQSLESSEMENLLTQAIPLLKSGGELRLSVVCCSRRLQSSASSTCSPAETGQLLAALTGGLPDAIVAQLLAAPYYADMCMLFERLKAQVDIRVQVADVPVSCDKAGDGMLPSHLKTKFYTCSFRLFAVHTLENSFEDYGQVATYNGELTNGSALHLDHEFTFPKGEPIHVDGNTARVLQTSWLRRYFTIQGDTNVHRGGFDRRGWRYALPRSELL